jgi:hypothetical protein
MAVMATTRLICPRMGRSFFNSSIARGRVWNDDVTRGDPARPKCAEARSSFRDYERPRLWRGSCMTRGAAVRSHGNSKRSPDRSIRSRHRHSAMTDEP